LLCFIQHFLKGLKLLNVVLILDLFCFFVFSGLLTSRGEIGIGEAGSTWFYRFMFNSIVRPSWWQTDVKKEDRDVSDFSVH